MHNPSLDDLAKMPSMTGWFRPLLLSKLIVHVIVSSMFGQYADRRLIHAALDQVNEEELQNRADLKGKLQRDEEGALWIDYVADLGDGFDATYAIAYLLAQESLEVDGHHLPRGQTLIMGGDQVYPDASLKDYVQRLRLPYQWAFPDNNASGAPHPPVFLIPGNHDWYDGLVLFLAMFCRRDDLELGSWRSMQRRSYFALQLTEKWWIWAIDIQLMEDIDQPQADYFETIAKGMAEGSNIILCTAAPGWLVAEKRGKSFNAMGYAAGIANKANREIKVLAILSGDTHHYSRYSYGPIQFVTSGGGGAFLHGTHQLKDEINAKWWLWKGANTLSLKTEPAASHQPSETAACYPSREQSRKLLSGNLSFYITNPEFAVLFGVIYWVFALAITARSELDAYIITLLALFGGLVAYTGYQEGWKAKIYISSAIHAAAHFAAVVGLTWFFWMVNTELLALRGFWVWVGTMLLEMVPFGAMIGGFIFGVYLLVTCRFLDMNHNDAFSAMRSDSYRHFLRIRVKGDSLSIYAIGLDSVPSRDGWKLNEDKAPPASVFAPLTPLKPHLIERGPIEIDAAAARPVDELTLPQSTPAA